MVLPAESISKRFWFAISVAENRAREEGGVAWEYEYDRKLIEQVNRRLGTYFLHKKLDCQIRPPQTQPLECDTNC